MSREICEDAANMQGKKKISTQSNPAVKSLSNVHAARQLVHKHQNYLLAIHLLPLQSF